MGTGRCEPAVGEATVMRKSSTRNRQCFGRTFCGPFHTLLRQSKHTRRGGGANPQMGPCRFAGRYHDLRSFKDRSGVGGASDNRPFLADTGLYTPGDLRVSNLEPSSFMTYTPSEETPGRINRVQIVSRGEPWGLTAISGGGRANLRSSEVLWTMLSFRRALAIGGLTRAPSANVGPRYLFRMCGRETGRCDDFGVEN